MSLRALGMSPGYGPQQQFCIGEGATFRTLVGSTLKAGDVEADVIRVNKIYIGGGDNIPDVVFWGQTNVLTPNVGNNISRVDLPDPIYWNPANASDVLNPAISIQWIGTSQSFTLAVPPNNTGALDIAAYPSIRAIPYGNVVSAATRCDGFYAVVPTTAQVSGGATATMANAGSYRASWIVQGAPASAPLPPSTFPLMTYPVSPAGFTNVPIGAVAGYTEFKIVMPGGCVGAPAPLQGAPAVAAYRYTLNPLTATLPPTGTHNQWWIQNIALVAPAGVNPNSTGTAATLPPLNATPRYMNVSDLMYIAPSGTFPAGAASVDVTGRGISFDVFYDTANGQLDFSPGAPFTIGVAMGWNLTGSVTAPGTANNAPSATRPIYGLLPSAAPTPKFWVTAQTGTSPSNGFVSNYQNQVIITFGSSTTNVTSPTTVTTTFFTNELNSGVSPLYVAGNTSFPSPASTKNSATNYLLPPVPGVDASQDLLNGYQNAANAQFVFPAVP